MTEELCTLVGQVGHTYGVPLSACLKKKRFVKEHFEHFDTNVAWLTTIQESTGGLSSSSQMFLQTSVFPAFIWYDSQNPEIGVSSIFFLFYQKPEMTLV